MLHNNKVPILKDVQLYRCATCCTTIRLMSESANKNYSYGPAQMPLAVSDCQTLDKSITISLKFGILETARY